MKKTVKKIILILAMAFLIALSAFTVYYIAVTADAMLIDDKLVNLNASVEIYDKNGDLIDEISGGRSVTVIDDIPAYTVNAFVAIEDKRFYSHHGVDYKGLIRAALNNIKSFSFKEGASTISQQLIKNTHLSGEKTLKRKLVEMKLARRLEQKYSKKEILEKYLNTIYFGGSCYGITEAANKYFGVSPSLLTVAQSAALAGIIKAPSIYSPFNSEENFNARKNTVLKEMLAQNFITEAQYRDAVNVYLTANTDSVDPQNSYIELVKNRLSAILGDDAYRNSKIQAYTYYDKNIQKHIESALDSQNPDTDCQAAVCDDKNHIVAYYSTCGEIRRQLGSTLKPLLVYAPALDLNEIYPCSPLLDEKININGYSPSNYKGVYHGYVSARYALSKSLNSCAVKLYNDCGTERCLSYLKNTDIPITEKDLNLASALGATEKGATLLQLLGAYGAFINKGAYITPSVIRAIRSNGNTVFTASDTEKPVYREDTACLINDMLKETVKTGTAKTLASLSLPLSAKTGTVGTEKGNTDAYCVSYTGDLSTAFWIGNKDNSLMPNSYTGGNQPTKIARSFWQEMINSGYKANDTFSSASVEERYIDKISSEREHKIELADGSFPDRYKVKELFSVNNLPKENSKRFFTPKVESGKISVNNYQITLTLRLAEYYDFKIYKRYYGTEFQIYDSKGKPKKEEYSFTDANLFPNAVYNYSVLPYYTDGDKEIYGEEFFFEQIKTPSRITDDGWWKDLI